MTIQQLERKFNVTISEQRSKYRGGFCGKVSRVTVRHISSGDETRTVPYTKVEWLFTFDGVSKKAFLRHVESELEMEESS